ncbi:translocation/assembly module TamB domain-containing protein, partial [Pseudorhodobacter sp.]|uniref:translocation/assembly module TamB domain-containing protein n=1 Tax=Pseudorhodobacter sp. TaxID=1934400 RepID=UPI0026474D0D
FLRKLNVAAQQLTANLSGSLASDGSDLKGKLRFGDLSALGAKYGGSLTADASFSGTPSQGRITLDGIGTDLKIGQQQVDAVIGGQSTLSVAVSLRDKRLEIEKAVISNPQINADAVGFYDPVGSDITANIALPNIAPLGPGYAGSLRAKAHAAGTLTAGRVTVSGVASNLAVGNTSANRVLAGESTLEAAANFRDGKLEIEKATIENPQLRASATGTVTENQRRVQLEARLANIALLVPDFSGPVTVSGSAVESSDGLALDLKGTGPGGIDATVSGRIAPGFRSADLDIKGSAQAALADVFLGQRAISGQTQFDLRLNGPLALSSLSGTAKLSNGRFSAPRLPFGLQGIAATATLGGSAARINVQAAPTTGGELTVAGSIGLTSPNQADLRVDLRGVTVKDPDLYEVTLNAGLTVQGPLTGGAQIGGEVRVSQAELRVPTTGFSAVGSLPGLKHRNESAPVRNTRAKAGLLDSGNASGRANPARPFGLDIAINAPSRVFLRGRGIDAELGGSVTLRGTTDTVIPSGSFELIRGRIDILGKRLVLTTATLSLQGDLIPTINIVATNQGDGVTTSVIVEGRADDPKISFTSSPDLPQEEVLAHLLFDRGLDRISAFQAAQLASAVATLAGKGGEGIVSKLRKGFGLDDLDIGTDAAGNVSVKAGKYISKRVYTEVEVDQAGRSKINLNLDLKKNVTVRGSVGADGEAGIGVFVEKDY